MTKLRLVGGKLFDPRNRIDGQIVDIWIDGGKIVAAPCQSEQLQFRTIDCSGRVIMPGGVDIHSHIVGPKVNAARKMQPELAATNGHEATNSRAIRTAVAGNIAVDPDSMSWRLGGNRIVPPVIDVGKKYVGLGYTTVFDAAIAPIAARVVHAEMEQLPYIDAGFFLLVGNHHFFLDCTARGDVRLGTEFLAWLLNRCGAYAPKLVNPGGVENFKRRRDGNARDLDEAIDGFVATPRKVIDLIASAAADLRLPHPIHIHCNNLGLPGNWTTTLETMRTLAGRRGHFAHVQFHSYGGAGVDETSFSSRVQPLAAYVNDHPEISVDVGQILFGSTTSMTGDNALGYFLSRLGANKYYSCDVEVESGCGISPIQYKRKSFVHSMQWAIGLEWFLTVRDPWQIALSTDHPNGASFLAYPQIIRLLMDAAFRKEQFARVNSKAALNSPLPEIEREYTLYEIAIITRAGPAQMLGLRDKGHLGEGADADITAYTPDRNYEQMFQLPWMVIKSGEVVLLDGELSPASSGKTLAADAIADESREPEFENWFSTHYSFSARHFGIPKNISRKILRAPRRIDT